MAYCRLSADSDVYLYATGPVLDESGLIGEADPDNPDVDIWICCGCSLAGATHTGAPADEPAKTLHSAHAALDHLIAHRRAGHKVPDYAIERLTHESGG